MTSAVAAGRTVRVTQTGLHLDGAGDLQPISGSIHPWRHSPAEWPRILDSFTDLGLRVVDMYIAWSVHEDADGTIRWDGNRDVVAFLRLLHERRLRAIVRVGPHSGAELSDSGIPARLHLDPRVQALRCNGLPYILPTATHHIAVPSYFSTVFREQADRWYADLVPRLAPLQWPEGPIVACQVDNEHGYFFQSHAYAMDYHPQALDAYRRWLASMYGNVESLNDAYGTAHRALDEVEPPRDVADQPERRRLDWVEWREVALRDTLTWLRQRLEHHGMTSVPFFHNDFPRTDTPLDQGALEASGAVDVAAVDIYATRQGARYVADLVRHAAGSSRLAWLAECGVGWLTLPWLLPMAVDPADTEFVALSALLTGARAVNFYMAVERERWYGSPIDRHGGLRPRADVLRRITGLLDRLRLEELRRDAPVLLLDDRAHGRRRAGRATLGGLVPAFAGQIPFEFALTRIEDDEDRAVDAWRRGVESLLRASGLDHDRASTSSVRELERYACVLVPCASALDARAWAQLQSAAQSGVTVVIGPLCPDRDEHLAVLPPLLAPIHVVDAIDGVTDLLPRPQYSCGSDAVALHRWVGADREVLAALNHSAGEVTTALSSRGSAHLAAVVGEGDLALEAAHPGQLTLAPWSIRVWEVTR